MEIWKDVVNYEGFYEVSNFGNIRGVSRTVPSKGGSTRLVQGRIKKVFTNRKGYYITTLSKNNKLFTQTVHQIVAQAFIPGFIKGTELNHIDGIKTNNRLNNLEISNSVHNQLHAVRLGLSPKQGTSIYRNVTYIKSEKVVKRWAACIRYNKKPFGWKTFLEEEDAARYVDFLLDSVGDTERLRNFPK